MLNFFSDTVQFGNAPFSWGLRLLTLVMLSLGADVAMQREEQILTCGMPDTDEVVAYENQDEEAVAMIEESPSCVGMISTQLGT